MLQQGEIYFRKSAAQSVSCPEKNNIWQIFILLLLKFGLDGWGLQARPTEVTGAHVGLKSYWASSASQQAGPQLFRKREPRKKEPSLPHPCCLYLRWAGRRRGGRNKIRQCFQLYPHAFSGPLSSFSIPSAFNLAAFLNPVFISCLT